VVARPRPRGTCPSGRASLSSLPAHLSKWSPISVLVFGTHLYGDVSPALTRTATRHRRSLVRSSSRTHPSTLGYPSARRYTFVCVYIIVDALDEFEDRKTFLPIITGMGSASGNGLLKIFVTSRREDDIVAHFAKCRTPALEIEATKVDTDINAFVRAEVGEWGKKTSDISLDDGLRSEIILALTSKSGGM
jgi:hypothetical protein